MKLSEAMMLGSAICGFERGNWNSCALGVAGNAVGIPEGLAHNGKDRRTPILECWPWLATVHKDYIPVFSEPFGESNFRCEQSIFLRFDVNVCSNQMTFEQLVDYVRSIEPDCGECNRFECTCQKEVASEPCDTTAVARN